MAFFPAKSGGLFPAHLGASTQFEFLAIGFLTKRSTVAGHGRCVSRITVSGADMWLNTPQPPMEASGTSGMKGAANGVPSLSILDGW
jgi:hypothetical protein